MTKTGFMCKTAFHYDLENDNVRIFDTIEALKAEQECVVDEDARCGIVEVTVTLVRVIDEGTF